MPGGVCRNALRVLSLGIASAVMVAGHSLVRADESPLYNADVRPILADY
jgi:hypothetical protein